MHLLCKLINSYKYCINNIVFFTLWKYLNITKRFRAYKINIYLIIEMKMCSKHYFLIVGIFFVFY